MTRPTADGAGRLRVRLALAAILLLALALRGMEARSGLPYLHHFDEPAIGHRALDVLRTGDWNPHFFHYPSLLLYLEVGVDVLHYFHLVSQPEDNPTALASLDEVKTGPDDDPWFISHPSFYLWNRRLTALFGTASVLLTFLLARRLRGPPGRAGADGSPGFREADLAGLLAALALATLPFHVVQSAFLSTDVPASTLALAAVFFSVRFVQDRRPWDLAWAALLVGLAASTKYNLASALAVPAVALIGVRFGPRLRRGADTDPGSSPPTRPGLWAALVALPAVGFLVGTPYALFDLRTFLDHAGYEVRHYLVLGHDPVTVEPGWPHLVADLEKLVGHAGLWLVLPALAGVAVALRRRAGWVAFLLPALQLLLTSRTSVDFHRNLLILYPFAAVAFGLGTVALLAVLGGGLRSRRPRWRRPAVIAGWSVVALLLGVRTVRVAAASWTTATTPETRSRAVDEINARAAAAARSSGGRPEKPLGVRIAGELELHPLDLERLELPFRVKPLVEIACEPEPRTRVLVPQRLSTWIRDRQPEVDRINGLLERGGPEVFAIPGRDTVLTHFSTDPAVVLRQPWSWSQGGALPVECASPPFTALQPVEGPAEADGEAMLLTSGGRAVSPFFTVPPGPHLATWNDAGPAAGPRLRARVVRRGPEGSEVAVAEETVAEEIYRSHPQGRRRRLSFELRERGEIRVRFEALEDGGSGGGQVRIRRLWLVSSDPPDGRSGD